MILINFKNYVHRKSSLDLAKKIQRYLPRAAVSVSPVDLALISKNTKLKVLAQHFDKEESDRATGFLTPQAVKSTGAFGSILNHSEHRLKEKEIINLVWLAHKHNIKVVLCVPTIRAAKKLMHLKPYAMAYEDKKLVGTGKSITKYRKGKVKKFAKLLRSKDIIPLCGAGVSTAADVKAAYDYGCKGVLIASAIADARNPDKILRDLSKI